jgi:hypothetical protein
MAGRNQLKLARIKYIITASCDHFAGATIATGRLTLTSGTLNLMAQPVGSLKEAALSQVMVLPTGLTIGDSVFQTFK